MINAGFRVAAPESEAIAHAPPREIRMKTAVRIMFGFFMICLISRNDVLFAQVSEHNANLETCRNGLQLCDRAVLTDEQSDKQRVETHRRNVDDCRAGIGSCNQSALTEPEIIALAIANHQHNVLACMDGSGPCDHAMLTPKEALAVAASERQHNISQCMYGWRIWVLSVGSTLASNASA